MPSAPPWATRTRQRRATRSQARRRSGSPAHAGAASPACRVAARSSRTFAGERPVVPIPERGDAEADAKIDQHQHADDVDRLSGVIDGDDADREEIGVADGDGKRAALGERNVLTCERRYGDAHRLGNRDAPEDPGIGEADD